MDPVIEILGNMQDMRTNFIIVFTGRAGSTHVCHSLNSHPKIMCKGEVLQSKSALEEDSFLRKLYRNNRFGLHAIGMKTKLRDVTNRDGLKHFINQFEVKTIFLYRKNTIKSTLSRLNGSRIFKISGKWNRENGTPQLPVFSPTIEEFNDALLDLLAREKEQKQFMSEIQQPILQKYYEELLADERGYFTDILEYLNVTPAPVSSNFVKNTGDDMRDTLLNYDEIQAYYKGSEFEAMFD